MKTFVNPLVFKALQDVDVKSLSKVREKDLRPVLPCLVRMALCKPLDESSAWNMAKKEVLKVLSGIEVVNSIVALLSIDFHALEQDVNKEQQLRYTVYCKILFASTGRVFMSIISPYVTV